MVVSAEQLQVNSKGTQPYIYKHLFSSQTPLSPRLAHNTEQSSMWLYTRSLLVIHFKYRSVYIIFPKSMVHIYNGIFSSVQFSHSVWLFVTPWAAAHQASLSITNSWSLLKIMSVESVMSSNHLVHCHPLLLLPSIFPSFRNFLLSQFFESGDQSIEVSTLASVLPMNIQDWFPLGWTGWISL